MADILGVRLLTFTLQEPLPGRVFLEMAAELGVEEAARRYRATVVTTLRQLRGLAGVRLRLVVEPEDGSEAVRFWLLPRLAERWQADDGVFRSEGWEIDFGGGREGVQVHAEGEILCPYLGARWVHTAMLGLGRTIHRVRGPAAAGGTYFHALSVEADEELPERILPVLTVIRTVAEWDEALTSALGPALKRAWEEEEA